jgi:5'-phosphate synthase pdxT subunit
VVLTVGVLALQGGFAAHERALQSLNLATRQVRTPHDLEGVDALVMPGGESTTMSMLLESSGLFDPIAARIAHGMPVFGTCAGMILLAADVLDGRADQRSFAAVDIGVQRNGYGRQVDSFETDLDVIGVEHPVRAVFIRAPRVTRVGPGVEVLARAGDDPVVLRQGQVMVASFHPELTDDTALHAAFLSSIHHPQGA